MTEAIASEVQTQAATEQVTAEQGNDAQATESISAGYNRIANPNQEQAKEEKPQTVETPPEPAFTNEQAKELMAQVARIPDLEKRLRDEGGRYGSLKQSLEQLQQRIATTGTGSKADVSKALEVLRNEYGELADLLQPAFEEIAKSGGQIDASTISQLVAEQRQIERQAEIEAGMQQLSELHPDWMEAREKPEFSEWKSSLSERDRVRFEKSNDPFYVSDMLDKHKDWLKSKKTKNSVVATQQPATPSKRLAAAVLPTSGTQVAPKGEPDTKASIRAGYERVAGARMR